MFARNWLSSARPLPALLGTVALALTVLAGPAARAQTAPAQQPAAAPTAQSDAPSRPDAPKPGLDKNGLPTSVVKVAAPPKDPDAVEPPRTDGPIDDIIITAPQFGNREEVEAFHKAEFERLDKIYGKHEEKRSRGDTLTKAPESNTGTTRDGPITLDR